jgi:urease accessory protein
MSLTMAPNVRGVGTPGRVPGKLPLGPLSHGTELPAGASGLLYSVGFVVATGTLHVVGIGIGVIHRWGWGRVALRATGGLVAAAAAFFLWRAFA